MVTSDKCTEVEVHRFVTEASALGLRPGQWPQALATDMGNKMPFVFTGRQIDSDNDLVSATYVQANGCLTLRVFND